MVKLDLHPLTPQDVAQEPVALLDQYSEAGMALMGTLSQWHDSGTKHKSSIQILTLPDKQAFAPIRQQLDLTSDSWCARTSTHSLPNEWSASRAEHVDEALTDDHPARPGMTSLYDIFREGLYVDHSEHECQYIESCQTADKLDPYLPNQAEVWRMAYQTPAPSTNRTFVILFMCKEMDLGANANANANGTANGIGAGTGRSFVNVTVPFNHPTCIEKQGAESSRVRGRYVSVEYVKEVDERTVEWYMATSSTAGGSIPQWMTNASLPGAISEDVPSFLQWLEKRYDHVLQGHKIDTRPVPPSKVGVA